jgi:hypothetical protein
MACADAVHPGIRVTLQGKRELWVHLRLPLD